MDEVIDSIFEDDNPHLMEIEQVKPYRAFTTNLYDYQFEIE